MMTNWIRSLVLALCATAVFAPAHAQERGTREEAQSVVKAAIAFHKANGKEKALSEANNPNSQFRKKDLYAFAYDKNGINLAHSNPKIVGKDLIELRDARGIYINKEFIKIADAHGNGWLKYDWPNSISKAIEPKESYVEKYQDVYWICGYYIPQ